MNKKNYNKKGGSKKKRKIDSSNSIVIIVDDCGLKNCTSANSYSNEDYISGDSDDITNRGKFIILFLNKEVYIYMIFFIYLNRRGYKKR